MNYIDKVFKLIKAYKMAFIINSIAFTLILALKIDKIILLCLAVVVSIIAIIFYKKFKKNNGLKNVGFYCISLSLSLSIAAVYEKLSYNLILFKGGEESVSLISIFILLIIIELMYLVMYKLIKKYNLFKSIWIISLILTLILILVGYRLSYVYGGIFWITLFYGIIFFSSMLSILLLKEKMSMELILMLSHFIIFVVVFLIALSIIAEDGSFLEFFAPDISSKKKS